MSKCSTKVALRGMLVALLAVGMQAVCANDSFASGSGIFESGTDETKLATYDNAGETLFALSITPKLASESQRASDVVVYVDTSASQAGPYKRDSIAALQHLIKNLNAEDRIQIVAVDLDPVPMTKGLVAPGSDEIAVAIENLTQRVSLGSTDIEAMLISASKAFPNTTIRNKNVIYIGDGVSRGNILQADVFGQLVAGLTENHISFSSFAIGPDRDNELMAALANNTGGNLFVDTDEEDSVRQSGIGLGATVHGSVLWPTDGKLDDSVVEIFPHKFPPMRTDRDTIVLGSLTDREAVELQVTGLMNGEAIELNWTIEPEASSSEFAFLPGMIQHARKDRGLTLPTVGSAGLREFARVRTVQANQLSDLGGAALATGNQETARKLASAAINLSADPANTKADLLAMAATYKIQGDDPFALGNEATQDPAPGNTSPLDEPAPQDIPVVQPDAALDTPVEDTLPVEPGQEQTPEPGEIVLPMETETPDGGLRMIQQQDNDQISQLLRDAKDDSRDMLLSEEDRIAVINQKITQQVVYETAQARSELLRNPDIAIERLKNMLEVVDQTPDLYASTRSQLRHKLESSLLNASQTKLEFDDRRALADINIATADELAMSAERFVRKQEEVAGLVNRYNALLAEGNYAAAVDVTEKASEIAADDPAVVIARATSHLARNYQQLVDLRREKEVAFLASMYEIEKVTVPFPGNPLMIFPDADEWRKKRIRRKKYDSIRLSGSENEEKILLALEQNADFDYDERPWNEIEEELETTFGINIVLTSSASDDSLAEDDPITENLTGIRLKNALRIMLEKKNATFVVKDEVLKIISLDDAEDVKWFVTNVYNVGDLVAPRTPVQGGGQGGGGFGGGQGGGGFGGGGQGGGGFGGGGQGGGGNFCVQESPVSVKMNFNDQTPVSKKPQSIELAHDGNTQIAWSNYFSQTFADPADVRATARKLMKQNKATEVVSMIHGAIQHDQFQPWMHEALVLAMQVAGYPQPEIERALLSTIDLSNDDTDVLLAAQYMAENGMELRAIRLLKSFARNNPTRTEPFVVGLRAAQKVNDIDGIKWATTGIFSQEWPDYPEIVKQAKHASTAIKNSLAQAGQTDELAAYEADLQAAQERDCFINVSWTGDADLDLYVMEPGGTTCSRLLKRTTAGGVLMRDAFTPKANVSGEISEQYILPKGFAGDYRLVIKRVWGEVTSGKVTVSIHNHYRSPNAVSMTKQVDVDDHGAMVLFSLDRGRRTESLEDHEIETVVKRQMIANRNILAQEVSDSYSSGAASDYFGGLLSGGNARLGNALNSQLAGRGVVGYTPIITPIFEGTQFQVNHATTADRLHVMISVSPSFTQITSVSTFNIVGDAATAQGLAQSGGGQGGGGQGGGGFGGGQGGGGAGGGGNF